MINTEGHLQHRLSTLIIIISIRFIGINVAYIIPNFYRTHFDVTLLLVKHCVISNGSLYGVSYFQLL